MPLIIIMPPPGQPVREAPPGPDGELRIEEAWPGSVECRTDESGHLHLWGSALSASGGLPPGSFGVLFIYSPEELPLAGNASDREEGQADAE